jgi:ribonuclease P protein component
MFQIEKIKTYQEIKAITTKGEKFVFKSAIVYKVKTENTIRIGILSSRKFGNAVKRNFAKRRIIGALHMIKKVGSMNLVFIPRNQILKMDFDEIKNEFKRI